MSRSESKAAIDAPSRYSTTLFGGEQQPRQPGMDRQLEHLPAHRRDPRWIAFQRARA